MTQLQTVQSLRLLEASLPPKSILSIKENFTNKSVMDVLIESYVMKVALIQTLIHQSSLQAIIKVKMLREVR